uniref:Transposase n=1 Tax=Mesocestoides corti TaxID=53468 RepID=A0A5K3FBE0_MESCO
MAWHHCDGIATANDTTGVAVGTYSDNSGASDADSHPAEHIPSTRWRFGRFYLGDGLRRHPDKRSRSGNRQGENTSDQTIRKIKKS